MPAGPMRYWSCGRFRLPLGRKTYLMGIVNATPDSFSGDGRLNEAALEHALALIEQGADILDIGGESTRPGAPPVTAEEELSRVIPLLQALMPRVEIPLSVDTTKAAVARAALEAGASIVNDISAGTFDSDMLATVAASDCGYVLMHLRGTPQTMGWSRAATAGEDDPAADIVAEVCDFFQQRLSATLAAAIDSERIVLDPGFGFGKSVEENLELIRRGRDFAALGYPVLSGTSRKSTVGKLLNDAPVDQRQWGTATTVALAIANGADIVRVHDVREMAQVARVTDAIVRIH